MQKDMILSILVSIVIVISIGMVIIFRTPKNDSYEYDPEYVKVSAYFCDKDECSPIFSHMGGDAMTYRNCEVCGKDLEFLTTYADVLCDECSNNTKRCRHCGTSKNTSNTFIKREDILDDELCIIFYDNVSQKDINALYKKYDLQDKEGYDNLKSSYNWYSVKIKNKVKYSELSEIADKIAEEEIVEYCILNNGY